MRSTARSRANTAAVVLASLVVGTAVMGWGPAGEGPSANPLKTTTRDRLAILYSPQFNFTRDGEPLIHAGVLTGVDKVSFSTDGPARILPLGDGGPELLLSRGGEFEVGIKRGRKGAYRHWVVVERVPYTRSELRERVIESWVSRGYLPKAIEVGGLFAIGSRRFDSRTVLIGVGGYDSRDEAIALADRLTARFGVETELHSEILRFPGGDLSLTGGGLPGAMRHKDMLWVGSTDKGQVFTLQTPEGKRRFKGSLVFTADARGHLSVVNAVPTETLLKGVVPSEVYASAHIESLKAQAVAARGEVLSAVGVRHIGDPFLLCSSVHCQKYEGLTREHPRTNRAVEETRGVLMLTDEAGRSGRSAHIVDARYSASCGGHTEHNDNVWGGAALPYLRGHGDADSLDASFSGGVTSANVASWVKGDVDAWCNTDRYGGSKTFRWTRSVKISTVQAYLDRHFKVGRLKDIKILERGVSGRVIRMKLIGESGAITLDRELSIRRAFDGLRSSLFVMSVDRDDKGRPRRFTFEGGGFGHGVGMCQTGAMMMAHGGRSYKEILGHYYRGVAIEKLY